VFVYYVFTRRCVAFETAPLGLCGNFDRSVDRHSNLGAVGTQCQRSERSARWHRFYQLLDRFLERPPWSRARGLRACGVGWIRTDRGATRGHCILRLAIPADRSPHSMSFRDIALLVVTGNLAVGWVDRLLDGVVAHIGTSAHAMGGDCVPCGAANGDTWPKRSADHLSSRLGAHSTGRDANPGRRVGRHSLL
jgi:hypothetical protein